MTAILIGNLPPETSEDDVRTLFTDLGMTADVGDVTIAEGLGEKLVASVSIDCSSAGAEVLVQKLSGHFWNGRELTASFNPFGQ
ncbi:RNA recognition motif domain-containing protein [Jeongeupia naejangsanensis]|uniref:RNA-binding protein n=1 Tax=Jeongeupia naejangsanensis TaxID=613195 RepID=A0ABS2BLY5_9NEIS|nr:RNA-binding protein [Jeongeupia naejangsanensis]MBM3116001.1 RNA-binding protein [Jeongeupia naejangsanensis]